MKIPLLLMIISQTYGKFHLGGGFNLVEFSFTPDGIREVSQYYLKFMTTSAIPSTALVKITLPSECSISSSSTYSCSLSNPQGSTSSAYCVSDSSSLSVTVYNFFSSGAVAANYAFPFSVTLNSVTNPRSNKPTSSIALSVTTSAGVVIDSDSENPNTIIQATAATVASASISSSTQIVGNSATLTFSITPTYSIPSGSVIQVQFPYWNRAMGATGTLLSHIISGTSPTCVGTVNMAASLSCSYSTASQILKVSNGFTTERTGLITFTVGSCTNPPNPNSLSGFTVYIRDANDYDYEISGTLSLRVTSPNAISIGNSNVEASVYTVSTSTTISLSFTIKNPMGSGFMIDITVPSEISFDSSMTVTGESGILKTTLARTITGSKIRITNGYTAYTKATQVWVKLNSMTTPSSTKTTGTFTVSTLTAEGEIIDTGTGGTLTATAGTLTQNSGKAFVTADSYLVGASTVYYFEFVIPHSLPSGAAITITFPSTVAVTDRSAGVCASYQNSIAGTATCAVTSRVLTVAGGFASGLTANNVIKFGISSVTNPISTAPTASFIITTYTDSTLAFQVDTVSAGATITAVAGTLSSVTVTPTSDLVGDLTTYTFTIVTTTTISIGGYLIVTFPSGVSISSITEAQNSCLKVSGFNSGTFSCTATSSSIQVNSAFASGSFSPGTLTFSVGYVNNPISTKSVQSFTVTTYDSAGYAIDSLSAGISAKVNTLNLLTSASVSMTSLVNGASTTYTFSVTPKTSTPTSCQVWIIPPVTVSFPSTPSCAFTASIISAISCSLDVSGTLKASLTLTSQASSSNVLSFTVASVKNPPTTEPSSTFKFYTYTSDAYGIDKKESGLTVTTTTAATLSTIYITANDNKIAVQTSYLINYVPVNTHPTGTVVTITLPSEFTPGTVSCSSSSLPSLTCVRSGFSIVTSSFEKAVTTSEYIYITITGITNPASLITTSAWSIVSKTGSYFIDSSSTVTSTFTCSSPCLTCKTTASKCESCLTTGDHPYLYSDTCNAECPSGQVDDTSTTDKVCVSCNSICKTCSGTPTYCTSCNPGTNPYLYSNTCNSDCEQGKYGDGTNCIPCNNPCLTCSSATDCKSCMTKNTSPDFGAQTFLFGTSCLVKCPTGYLPNSSNLKCDQCDSSCLTCSSSITTCTSCSEDKYLLNSKCTSQCPADGTYIVTGNVCYACTSPCATCSGTVTTCLTCVSNYHLYSGSCLLACPSGFVSITGVCTACKSPCATCTTSTAICTSCITNYYLYSTACFTTCPNGYVSDGIKCVACDASCYTCESAANFCTSCTNGLNLKNNKCVSDCGSDSYVAIANKCETCLSPCATCSSTTTFCKTCISGFKLYKNSCVASCTSGSTIDNGSECFDCNSICKTCSGTINTCVTCQSSMYLEGTTCVDSCSVGFLLVGSVCTACATGCFSCSGTTNHCTKCKSNYYMLDNTCNTNCPENYVVSYGECVIVVDTDCNTGCTADLLANNDCNQECNVVACQYDKGLCVGPTSCLDGQYQINNKCYSCSNPCNKCTAPNTCVTCMVDTDGYQYLFYETDAFCYKTCPDGTYRQSLACLSCDSLCLTCSGSSTTCLTCKVGFLLYNNQCIAKCIDFYTIQSGSKCEDCDSNCKTCSVAISTCTSCNSDKVLQGSSCKVSCDSGYTVTSGSNICVQCIGCLTCAGSSTTCTSCSGAKYLYNSECVSTCPDGSYQSGNNCNSCDSTCVTCSGSGSCITCKNNYYKYGSLCLSSCPSGYENTNGVCTVIVPPAECKTGCTSSYLNNNDCELVCNYYECNYDNLKCKPQTSDCDAGKYFTGSSCVDCSSPCLTCTAPSTCTTCSTSSGSTMFLYQNYCYPACPSGTMQNGVICEKCSSSCKECAVTTSTCISCETSKFLYGGTCVNICPALYTITSGTVCESCSSNCETCSGTIDNCLSCPSGKVLQGKICQPSCNTGFTTTSASPKICSACTGNCVTCSGETYECTSCLSPNYLYEKTCISACPAKITVVVGSVCQKCTSPCSECQGVSTYCTICVSGYSLSSGQCLSTCPSGFEPVNSVCTALCSDGCSSSNLKDTVCQTACNVASCNKDNGYCVTPTVCDTYQYQDGANCIACTYPCNSCTSPTYCLSCKTSTITNIQLYYYSGKCYDSCPDGTYLNGIVCLACDSKCKTCKDSSTSCTSCPGSNYLYNKDCRSACPTGTTVLKSGVCYDCSDNCLQCAVDTDKCTKCPTGTVLVSSTCIASCPSGFTTTADSNGECLACSTSCKTCLTKTTDCLSCPDGKILYLKTCVTECPEGFTNTVDDPTICTACLSNCLSCSESTSKCTSCGSGLKLSSSNTCISNITPSCPDGYTITPASTSDCFKCETPCITCSGATTYCLTCTSPLLPSGGKCVTCTSPCLTCTTLPTLCTSCESGYFLSGTACKTCSSPCATCESLSTKCLSCVDGFLLSGNSCLKCNSVCLTCAVLVSTCTSCESGKFLKDNSCVSCSSPCSTCEGLPDRCTGCGDGYYLDGSNKCIQCSTSCKTCSGSASTCLTCYSGKVLINTVCGSCDSTCETCSSSFSVCDSCKTGLTLISGVCAVCSSNCLTCVTNHNTCGSCKDGLYLDSGSCKPCSSPCLTCSGSATSCRSCSSPYNLFGDTCKTCTSPCKTCSGSESTCTSCIETYNLMGSECKQCQGDCRTCEGTPQTCKTCFDGYYLIGTLCLICDSNCLTCSQSSKNCISCPVGSTLTGGTCYYQCADGYVLIGIACVKCDPSCKTCAGTASTCTTCNSGILFENKCISVCPTGYYFSGTTCRACSTLCKTCDTNPSTCLSCNTGYALESSTCKLICSSSQYFAGGTCYDCNSNCLTCETKSTTCTSCKNSDEIVNSLGRCEVPCPGGYVRSSKTNECEQCSLQCKTCETSINTCTACNSTSQFLYEGGCYNECPANITVPVNSECVACQSPCKTCKGTKSFCLSCVIGKFFYFNSCLTSCPPGYKGEIDTCVKCLLPDCSEESSSSSNSSSSTNSSSSSNSSSGNSSSGLNGLTDDSSINADELKGDPVPFPFSGATVATAGVVGITKLTAVGVNFVPSVISVWGVMAAGSWIFLAAYLPGEGEYDYSRRLAETMLNPAYGDIILTIALIIIVVALTFHLVCNLLYTTGFLMRTWNKDTKFKYWRKLHPYASKIISVFSYAVSFHAIRLFYCGMCNQSCFKVDLDNMANIKKGLAKYGYVSLLCTHMPMIAGQILILVHFQQGYWIWMFALDSLIITVFLTFFIFCDLRNIEKDLLKYELEKIGEEDGEKLAVDDQLKDLIDMFPPIDLTGMVPSKMPKGKIRKGISRSICETPADVETKLARSHSFPKLDLAGIEIRPEDFRVHSEPQIVEDEPYAENILPLKETSFIGDEPTILEENPVDIPLIEQIESGELYSSNVEYKNPLTREQAPKYVPFNIEPRTEEFTEIIAFTEIDSAESSLDNIEELKQEEEPVHPEPVQEDPRIIHDLSHTGKSSPSEDSSEEHLGTINEENELEIEKAIADMNDPEVISVPHIETGRRVKIKKDFKGARVVDLENKVDETVPPVDDKHFDIPKTIVDESDVRFATLTSKKGEKVRVKRNFKGARIVDLEKRVTNPNAFLIGKSVENENEFQFPAAYPDPEDPEVVVVTHKETGEEVKVRKTFQDAFVVDDKGRVIPQAAPIDRNEYDIPRTIVDKEDVHLATLSHKFTKARVRVRRDFKGAKIIDLERKSDNLVSPKRKFTHVTEKSEPEPLSPDLSDLEFIPYPEEDFEIPRTKKVPRPKMSPGRERLADLAKIISEESKGMHSPSIKDYPMPVLDSDEELDFMPEPEVPHYRDLDDEFDSEFGMNSMLDESESSGNLRGFGKKKRKKAKKFRPADAFRMKGLEEIYLERQGVKKRPGMGRGKFSEDILEPDMEIDDLASEVQYDAYRGPPLERAGEEIVRGRAKRF